MDAISQTFSNAFSEMKIPIRISRKFVPKGPINNIPALVQIMAWRRPDAKPLSEPMMISLPTHICVTRPQCVKSVRGNSHWTSFQSLISRNICFSFLQRPSVVIGHTKKMKSLSISQLIWAAAIEASIQVSYRSLRPKRDIWNDNQPRGGIIKSCQVYLRCHSRKSDRWDYRDRKVHIQMR